MVSTPAHRFRVRADFFFRLAPSLAHHFCRFIALGCLRGLAFGRRAGSKDHLARLRRSRFICRRLLGGLLPLGV